MSKENQKNMKQFFNKDDWWLGIAVGAIPPPILYVIILLAMKQWGTTSIEGVYLIKQSSMMLIALFSNMLTFRYYMVKLKYDRTGRGILLVTFAYAAVFFFLFM